MPSVYLLFVYLLFVYLLFVYLLLIVKYFDFAGLENGNIIIY